MKRHIGCQRVWVWVQAQLATVAPGPATFHGVTVWPPVWLPFSPCSLSSDCLPCTVLTVSTICLSHCALHACRIHSGFHAHPAQHTHLHRISLGHFSSCTQCPLYLQNAPYMPCLLYSPYPSVYSACLSCQTLPVLLAVPKLSPSPCSLYLLCMLCGTPAQEASPLRLQTEGMCLPGDWTGEIRELTAERWGGGMTEKDIVRDWARQKKRGNNDEGIIVLHILF